MKMKHLSLISVVIAVSLLHFCANPSLPPSSPELAATHVILVSPSTGDRDSIIVDSVGVEIDIIATFELGYYITHFTIKVCSDEDLNSGGACDTLLEHYFKDEELRDSVKFSLTFKEPGTKHFVVTTFKRETSPTISKATAYIILPNIVLNNTLPTFISGKPGKVYRYDDGDLVSFEVIGTDIDSNTLTYSFTCVDSVLPRVNTAVLEDGYFQWQSKSGDKGVYSLEISVNDGFGSVGVVTTLVIGDVPFNSPPEITTTPPLTARPGKVYEYHPVAKDEENSILKWSLVGTMPEGMQFDDSLGQILWVPPENSTGSGPLTLIVTDMGTPPKSDSQHILISVADINQPPIARNRSVATERATPVTITLNISDKDDSALTCKIVSPPVNGTAVLSNDTTLIYTPENTFEGVDTLKFTVTDPYGNSDTALIRIYVAQENQKPVASGNQVTTSEDTPFQFELTATDVESADLSYTIISYPDNGLITGTDAALTYSPHPNFNGIDTLTFIASDGTFDSDPAMVLIVVLALNDTPIVQNIGLPTEENTPVAFTLNIIDPDDSLFTFTCSELPQHGTISSTGFPEIVYTPSSGFIGTDSLFVQVSDEKKAMSVPARIIIVVGSDNAPPTAVSQTLTVAEDASLSIHLSGNDPEGAILRYTISKHPVHGQLSGNGAALTYQPTNNFHGTDSLVFAVSDGLLISAPATVLITITPQNDAPFLQSQSVTTSLNVPIMITLTANDDDDSVFTYEVTDPPSNGTIDLSEIASGQLQYTPDQNFKGSDSITVIARDAADAQSNAAIIAIAVATTNQRPMAHEQDITINEDETRTIFLTGEDIETSNLIFSITSNPSHGQFEGSLPNISYRPTVNYNGSDTFSFVVSDGDLISTPARVTITINALNDPPVAFPVSATTGLGESVTVRLSAFDVDDVFLAYGIVSQPSHGTVDDSQILFGRITYTPNQNYKGYDSIYYCAYDDDTYSSARTRIVIGVALENQRPIAHRQTVTFNEDSPGYFELTGEDLEGDQLYFNVTQSPRHGTLEGTPPVIRYVPNHNFFGMDSLFFTVRDSSLTSNPACVHITVHPVNDPPEAQQRSLSVELNTPVTTTLSASDPDGDPITFVITAHPGSGAVDTSAINHGEIVYTPDHNFKGDDSLIFIARDPSGSQSIPTRLIFMVGSGNYPPVAQPQTVTIAEDISTSITLSAEDPENDPLIFSIDSDPHHGTLTGSDSIWIYHPDENYNGVDTFHFSAFDGTVSGDPVYVAIIITPVNDPPVATPPSVDPIPEDTPTSITLIGSDPDGDALTFTITTSPVSGAITGTLPNIIYTPDENYNGNDAFSFTVSDSTVESDPVTVNLIITPVNDAPVVDDQNDIEVPEEGTVSITLTGSDVEGDPITFAIETQPVNGTVSQTGSTAEYTPAQDFSGTDQFTFSANDGDLTGSPGTITINITPINDAPVVDEIPDQSIISGGVFTQIQLDDYVTDPDNTDNEISWSASGTTNLSIILNNNRIVTIEPVTGWIGSESVIFTATDPDGLDATTEVTFTVTENQEPTITAIADQVITINTTSDPIAFTISDDITPPDQLTVSAESDNLTLIRNAGLTLAGTGGARTITIAPETDQWGEATITIEVSDDDNSAQTQFTVTVNAYPSATSPGHPIIINQNTAGTFTLVGSDPEGSALTFSITTNSVHGTISGTLPDVIYTPENDYIGSDSFEFSVTDALGLESTPAVVTLDIQDVNQPPSARDTTVHLLEGETVPFSIYGSDPENDILTFSVVTAPQYGILDTDALPDCIYTHVNTGESGDAFTFTVSDGEFTSNEGTVSLVINLLPLAHDTSITVEPAGELDFTIYGSDPEGEQLIFTIVSDPIHGTLSGSIPQLTYTSTDSSQAVDTFTFTVSDEAQTSTEATVSIIKGTP